MDTKKFEALLISAEQGSFTKSAQDLGCTQSGLTHMMNALEKEVGFPLLERGHYGTRLTDRGEQLLPYVRQFLQSGKELSAKIEAIRRQESQRIRVGAFSSMALHWAPVILQRFRQDYPELRVEIQMGSMEEVYGWVRTGEVDLGMVSRQPELGADFFPLKDDPLVAILPPDYDCVVRDAFDVTGFNNKEFLMPSLGFTRDIMPVFRRSRVRPKIQKTTVDDAVVISMVAHGLGYSIMSELIMQGMPRSVQVLPLRPQAGRELGLIVRDRTAVKPTVQALIDCAGKVVAELK